MDTHTHTHTHSLTHTHTHTHTHTRTHTHTHTHYFGATSLLRIKDLWNAEELRCKWYDLSPSDKDVT